MGPSQGRRFQVLALDGGGVRGIFAAAVLARLEEDLGISIAQHFDLVVGTSTGGIIALGLGAGLRPHEILEFYVAEKDHIFSNPLGWRNVRHLFRPKYRPDHLEVALRRILDNTLLGESRIPLVIPSYNLADNDVYLFKTPHHRHLKRDHRVPMWVVAMATSAAPTYFPTFRLPSDNVRLVDGGVWANNPAMVGVTEAVSMFGYGLDEIRVLSLGATSSPRTRAGRLDHGGLLTWARGPSVVDVLLTGQSVGAFTQVLHLVGSKNAHRLNPTAPDELARMDSCNAHDLIGKAAHHSRTFSPTFEKFFADHTPAPYVPLFGPNSEVGDDAHN